MKERVQSLDVGDYMALVALVFAACGAVTGDTNYFIAFAILWSAAVLRSKP